MEAVQTMQENTPTASRTIRIGEGDINISVSDYDVSTSESGKRFMIFKSIESAMTAFQELRAAEIRTSYVTYSLFVKCNEELTDEMLRDHVLEVSPTSNITYLRIDSNMHTGKLVVDMLSDYQAVKASSGEVVRFFHFDPKRVKPRFQNQGRSENSRDFRSNDQSDFRNYQGGGGSSGSSSGPRPNRDFSQGGRGGGGRGRGFVQGASARGGRGGRGAQGASARGPPARGPPPPRDRVPPTPRMSSVNDV